MTGKKIAILGVLAMMALGTAAQADKPVLGVAEFHNSARGVSWWYGGVGWDLSDMLANELVATGAFNVVERAKLEHVLREQDLADYGRIAPGTGAQIGKLTGAQYLVLGTVSSFEHNVKGTGGGIGFRGVRVGGKKDEAYMAVDLRVVNSTTGEIEFVRSIEARAGGKGIRLGLYKGGFSGNLAKEDKTPVGKAIRACLIEITDYLECAMVTKGSCMDEYDAKDRSRREKTKGSIKLD